MPLWRVWCACFSLSLLCEPFYNFRRITGNDGIVGHITGHDRAGSYHHVVANGNARQDCGVASYPYTVADCHGACPLYVSVASFGIEWVAGGEYADIGPYESIVADAYFGFVKDCKIEIGYKILSDMDIAAVIAAERLVYDKS